MDEVHKNVYKTITRCRICGNDELTPVLNLGMQYLTSVFPKDRDAKIEAGPLELVKCAEKRDGKTCGLLQLRHTFNPDKLYGDNYGYRSGINQTMTKHLYDKVKKILKLVRLKRGDIALDIGSNDATLLKGYPPKGVRLIGIDPSGAKFKEFYPDYIELIQDYFSASVFKSACPNKKARIITAIAMCYDLESPLDFMRDINEILADDGIWLFEQSYMPVMLENNSYDTICHEHLEYYGLRQIKWIAEKTGFKILNVELNDINGGSFSVTAAKKHSRYKADAKSINGLLRMEKDKKLDTLKTYADFRDRVFGHREGLIEYIKKIKQKEKTIFGYGASTKGNVILQFCGLDRNFIEAIAERNPDKYGCFTPGTFIPIISEEEARRRNPDYFLVLPWHFRQEFLRREKDFLSRGGRLLFPLPVIESVAKKR